MWRDNQAKSIGVIPALIYNRLLFKRGGLSRMVNQAIKSTDNAELNTGELAEWSKKSSGTIFHEQREPEG